MLIVNDEQRRLAGLVSLEERCKYCSKALAEYPLIQSDDADQTVYHTMCAVELATDIMVDLFTFFSPPAPYQRLLPRCCAAKERSNTCSSQRISARLRRPFGIKPSSGERV